MHFIGGKGKRGPFKKGCIKGWDWLRPGGGYAQNEGFFSVHWEVHDHAPESIKLHVEAPKAGVDPELNKLKQEVIEALLKSNLYACASTHFLIVKEGPRTKLEHQKGYKSTEAFRVVLSESDLCESHKENVHRVHEALGAVVEAVLSPLRSKIDLHFK